jgi:hypothetical protein
MGNRVSDERPDFSLRVPEDWYELDLDRKSRKKSIEQAVDEQVRANPVLDPAREAIIERLLGFAADAEEKGALAGATLWTVIESVEVAANVMVFSVGRDSPRDLETELSDLEAHLGRRSSVDVGDRLVERVTLPAGAAIRLRVLAESSVDPTSNGRFQAGRGGGGIVVDTVQHWLPVPDAEYILLVSGTTPCLAYGDDLAEVFDSIAGSLRLL